MRAIFKHRPEIEALPGGDVLADAIGELVNAINTLPIFIGTARVTSGTGTPQYKVTGSVGDLYLRQDGGTTTTLYVKTSGTNSNTGWVGK